MGSDILNEYKCTYCQEEITTIRVKCSVCISFELCLMCFSEGAEIGTHKKDHPYQLIDFAACDLFGGEHGSWSGREVMLLLHSIEKNHYGNWKCISQHIGTKTPEEARIEYNSKFLDGDIGRHTWVPSLRSRWRLPDLTVAREDDPLAQDLIALGLSKPILPDEVREKDAIQLEYMPLRDTFKEEVDNDAELLVSSLTYSPDDDELENALKVTMVEMYNQRLREREKSHRVVRENKLIHKFFDKSKKKVPREDKEVEEKLRTLSKLHAHSVAAGVRKVRKLSQRLRDYVRYRHNGLVRLEEISHFDQERQLRHNGKTGSGSPSPQHVSVISNKKEVRSRTSEPDPNAHLLSSTEAEMCSGMDITPSQFLSIKTLMLVEPEMKAEVEGGRQMLDHLVNNRWLINPS